MFKAIDNWIINKYQVGYTYVWNYTGITKGAIQFVIWAYFTSDILITAVYKPTVAGAIFVCIFIYLLYVDYQDHIKQINGLFKNLNDRALRIRTSYFYTVFRYIALAGAIYFAYQNLFDTGRLKDLSLVTFIYLMTTMVTDRELPEKKTQMSFNPT